MFADAHGCDFGGHGASDSTCDHEPAEDGREFSRDGEHNELRDGSCCEGVLEACVGLQDEHHSGEGDGEGDDGQRVVSCFDDLFADLIEVERRAEEMGEGEHSEGCDFAQRFEELQDRSPDDAERKQEQKQRAGEEAQGHDAERRRGRAELQRLRIRKGKKAKKLCREDGCS